MVPSVPLGREGHLLRTSLAGWGPASSGTPGWLPLACATEELAGFLYPEVSTLSISECSPPFAKVPSSCLGNVSTSTWRWALRAGLVFLRTA